MRRLAVLLLLAGAVPACGGPGPEAAPAGEPGAGGDRPSGEVVVFAASSLTEPFRRVAGAFEAEHPGTTVTFSFGGSSSLGPQVAAGAPADVFAAASPVTMAAVADAGAVAGRPRLFARNRLQIAVPAGNPGGVRGLRDFARPELDIAICAPEVPCGAAAQRAFDVGGVQERPDTQEQEVKAVLTKVELGEVDAGMVYRTDVRAARPRVRGIAFPEADRAVNDYQVAALADAPNPVAARAWVRFVLSPPAQRILTDAGFERP